MITRRVASAGALAALLSGCTATMTSAPLKQAGPREGIGYVLPYTNWSVTVAWRLDYCPDRFDPAANNGKDASLAVKVEAVAGSADDGELQFLINPQDLQTPTSITTFGAKWHDGRNVLSSINASVEDRTAQVIGNIVKTAVKVIPLAIGLPAPGAPPLAPGEPPRATRFCLPTAATALEIAKTATALVETREGELKGRTAVLTALTTKVAAMSAAIDDATKTALGTALDDVVKARRNLIAAEEALGQALEAISYTRKLTWPNGGNEFSGGPITVDPDKVTNWVQLDTPGDLPLRDVYLQIERVGSFGRTPTRTDRRSIAVGAARMADPSNPIKANAGADAYRLPDGTSKGLRYRMPARGLLVACSRSPCGSEDRVGKLAEFEVPVAQLGYVNVLPFRSRAFGSNAFTAEINIDGSLKSVGYEQKTAPAEGATGPVAEAASQLSGVLDPTARLQAGTTHLTALKARRDALEALRVPKDDPVATETSALGAETALSNAKLARLQAEIALEQLQVTLPQ